jgi:hypothetical protein
MESKDHLEQVKTWRQKTSRRPLSDNTTKDYKSAFTKLTSVLGEDLMAVVKDKHENTKKLTDAGYKDSRIRNFYNAYVNLMRSHKIDDDIISYYSAFIKNHHLEYLKSQQSNQLVSQSQIENMISYPELIKYINTLDKQSVDEKEYTVLMILHVMKDRPYRINEFSRMKLVSYKFFDSMDNSARDTSNWLVKKGWDYFFYFEQHNSTKSRPSPLQKIDRPLGKIFRRYIKDRKIEPLQRLFPYTPEHLSMIMREVSTKHIGKAVSSAILRKVVVSHKYQKTKKQTQEQIDFAKSIGHNIETENLIYNKEVSGS